MSGTSRQGSKQTVAKDADKEVASDVCCPKPRCPPPCCPPPCPPPCPPKCPRKPRCCPPPCPPPCPPKCPPPCPPKCPPKSSSARRGCNKITGHAFKIFLRCLIEKMPGRGRTVVKKLAKRRWCKMTGREQAPFVRKAICELRSRSRK